LRQLDKNLQDGRSLHDRRNDPVAELQRVLNRGAA
jgi:hypothetical protein